MVKKIASDPETAASVGFEAKLWLAADKLRNNRDAAEYKHVLLGLIFLMYISDTFEKRHAKFLAREGDYARTNREDSDDNDENVNWWPADVKPHIRGGLGFGNRLARAA